jgi:hypothetical protein
VFSIIAMRPRARLVSPGIIASTLALLRPSRRAAPGNALRHREGDIDRRCLVDRRDRLMSAERTKLPTFTEAALMRRRSARDRGVAELNLQVFQDRLIGFQRRAHKLRLGLGIVEIGDGVAPFATSSV